MDSSSEESMTTSDESSLSLDQGDQRDSKSNLSIEDSDHLDQLKNLQISYNQFESRYLKSVHELECQFHQQCSHLFNKRSDVINGNYVPNEDECRLKTEFFETIEGFSESNDEIGIPAFWLETFKQAPMIAELIEEWDEPILQCLSDLRFRLQTEPFSGFTLEFYFNQSAKDYFHNEMLTKSYELQIEPDGHELFYEGAAIIRSIGCSIDWLNCQVNVTENHQTNQSQSSFFHFFNTTTLTDDWKLVKDFRIGHYIRENLIPKAILYYTGEIFDNDDEEDLDFSDDDESEEEQQELGEGEH